MSLLEPNCHCMPRREISDAPQNNRFIVPFMHLKLRNITWRWEEVMWGLDYRIVEIMCFYEGGCSLISKVF